MRCHGNKSIVDLVLEMSFWECFGIPSRIETYGKTGTAIRTYQIGTIAGMDCIEIPHSAQSLSKVLITRSRGHFDTQPRGVAKSFKKFLKCSNSFPSWQWSSAFKRKVRSDGARKYHAKMLPGQFSSIPQ